MATMVNVHEAKTHLSRLLEKVEQGEEIIIARAGKPVGKIVAFDARPAERQFGLLRGQLTVPADFDTMFEAEIDEMFYGKPDESGTQKLL